MTVPSRDSATAEVPGLDETDGTRTASVSGDTSLANNGSRSGTDKSNKPAFPDVCIRRSSLLGFDTVHTRKSMRMSMVSTGSMAMVNTTERRVSFGNVQIAFQREEVLFEEGDLDDDDDDDDNTQQLNELYRLDEPDGSDIDSEASDDDTDSLVGADFDAIARKFHAQLHPHGVAARASTRASARASSRVSRRASALAQRKKSKRVSIAIDTSDPSHPAIVLVREDGMKTTTTRCTLMSGVWTLLLGFTAYLVAFGCIIAGSAGAISTSTVVTPNTLCIPGGGASGVAHMIGQLQSVPREELLTQTNVCVSAGCAALVLALEGWSFEQYMEEIALPLQAEFLAGGMYVHEALIKGVDEVIARMDPDRLPEWLGNVAITTAALPDEYAGPSSGSNFGNPDILPMTYLAAVMKAKPKETIPESYEMLRDRLIQTMWIPGATALGTAYRGHLDGGFVSLTRNKCERTLTFGTHPSLVLEPFNFWMSKETAASLYKAGRELGI